MSIDLIVEGLVSLLLIITASYCYILDRRLRDLKSGQDGMRDLIRMLNQATEQAQAAIAQLKISGDAAGGDLKETVAKARALTDELALMLESGNNIADRLEGSASQAMIQNNQALKKLREASAQNSAEPQDVDESLMKALRQTR